jgi:hypothetical protein
MISNFPLMFKNLHKKNRRSKIILVLSVTVNIYNNLNIRDKNKNNSKKSIYQKILQKNFKV